MNIVERVLEIRIQELVNLDAMQFSFLPARERQAHCCEKNARGI